MSQEILPLMDDNGGKFVDKSSRSFFPKSALQRIQDDLADLALRHEFTPAQMADISSVAVRAAHLGRQHPDLDRPYVLVDRFDKTEARVVIANLSKGLTGEDNG